MMKTILSLLCCVLASIAFAQTGKISVTIQNEKHSSVENATVELRKSKDSSLIKVAITNNNGVADFENISFGSYIIKASDVNYATQYSAPFVLSAEQSSMQLPIISLLPKSAQLKEVAVTTTKPFIQRLSDRIVVNVDNSIISAGSSAMDVLERSPGVNIDQNDVISLRGKQGVIIMIDGKPTPMTGTDLANYLRGLPSNAIDRIDIITNPSAKYDAAGNSGIIDIHMKKDQRMGTNGTFTAGYGQGIYPKANSGITLNYRNKKINLFRQL